jgi:N-acetyl-1-D-myo-inositol-2-amino-2-deoxy-alpha-D-glucopyranoside deacetylase
LLRKRNKKWVFAGVVMLIVLIGLLYRPYLEDFFFRPKKMEIEQMKVGERTLIIAPHPDDETLGGAGIIQKALAAGKQVKVVIMTCGDGFPVAVMENYKVALPGPADYRRMGVDRHKESLVAMKLLGMKPEDVIFLGYPDGGMNKLWQSNWDEDHVYLGLNGAVRSPYPFVYEKGVSYCGANVAKNLRGILHDFRPTDIVYPDPNDQHPDHRATNAFMKYALIEEGYHAKEWTYLVHRGDFPVPWIYEPHHSLNPPHALTGLDTNWIDQPLSEGEERKKREAILKYVTQVKVMDPFLDAFVRTNELFGTYNIPILRSVRVHFNMNELIKLKEPFIKDAVEDTVGKELNPEVDIQAVGGLHFNQRLYIWLETRAPISKQALYNIRIRFFKPYETKRMDISFQNSQLSSHLFASNSLNLPHGSVFFIRDNRLWISLPDHVLNGVTNMLVSADTLIGSKQMDKTDWRQIQVKK